MATVPNFKGPTGLWLKSYSVEGKQYMTVSGQTWKKMMERCTPGSSEQRNRPTMEGNTVSTNFQDFQKFTEWHISQIGFGMYGYSLDKDALNEDKHYCAENCVLLPVELNRFFTKALGTSEEWIWKKAFDADRWLMKYEDGQLIVDLRVIERLKEFVKPLGCRQMIESLGYGAAHETYYSDLTSTKFLDKCEELSIISKKEIELIRKELALMSGD